MIRVELFINEIYDFLRTITIKNTYIEDSIKFSTMRLLGVDVLNQRDNPYFHNLLGEYGPHDELMFINSLDDGTEILFSKVNLEIHPKTKFAYSVYTRYYQQLEISFPLQKDLIKSIRYPVTSDVTGIGLYQSFHQQMFVTSIDNGATVLFDINLKDSHPKTWDAYRVHSTLFNDLITQYGQKDLIQDIRYPGLDYVINAIQFELLEFDPEQLESNEITSIVDAIKNQLEYYRVRWHVVEYAYEEYYPTILWTIIWNTLPNIILNQRVRNLRTSNVHSAYIWEFLTSKGLGDYRSILNREQQLFLYKNINYLIRNRGKDGTLFILADRLLSPRNVTLDSKSIVLNTFESEINSIPTAEIISSDTRDITTPSQDAENGFETIESIFDREFTNGLEPVITPEIVSAHKERLSYAGVSWLPTKLVELNATDLFNSNADFYIKFALETIGYRLSRNELNYNIVVTNDEELSFTVAEAFALAYYSIQREFEQTLLVTAENIISSVDNSGNPDLDPTFNLFNDPLVAGLTQNEIDELSNIQLVGRTIIHNGIFVVVDNSNKASFVGEEVVIRFPVTIPTKMNVSLPYPDILPPVIDDFSYAGRVYKISRLIDTTYISNNVLQSIGVVSTDDNLLSIIDSQFAIKQRLKDVIKSSGNLSEHLAFDLLNRQWSVATELSFDLGTGFTEYEDWFNSNVQLRNLIDSIEAKSDSKLAYADLANDLLSGIIPIEDSEVITFNTFTANDFSLMKQLFIQLCSYNITFLETSKKQDSYIDLVPNVIDDKMDREIDLFTDQFTDIIEFNSVPSQISNIEINVEEGVYEFLSNHHLNSCVNPVIDPNTCTTIVTDIPVSIDQEISFEHTYEQGNGYA